MTRTPLVCAYVLCFDEEGACFMFMTATRQIFVHRLPPVNSAKNIAYTKQGKFLYLFFLF